MAFVRELNNNIAVSSHNHEMVVRDMTSLVVADIIDQVKFECVKQSKIRSNSARCHVSYKAIRNKAVRMGFESSLNEVLNYDFFKRAIEITESRIRSLGFATVNFEISKNIGFDRSYGKITVSVGWPTPLETQQPENVAQPEMALPQELINLEAVRADIDRAIMAISQLEVLEKTRQLNALRLRWHPDKHMASGKFLATAVTQMINAAMERYFSVR